MTGCGSSTAISVSELTAESKPATQYTIDANQEVYALLDFEDTAESFRMRPNMGWYDGNPVHLAELTPSDYAQKLVEYFGDTDAVQKNAENVAALIEQEGDETCLTRLMDAVTVTSEYKYFNIIEP